MYMEVFMIGAWSIWKERNNKIFRGIPHSLGSWKERFKTDFALLLHRVKPSLKEFVTNFTDSLA